MGLELSKISEATGLSLKKNLISINYLILGSGLINCKNQKSWLVVLTRNEENGIAEISIFKDGVIL